MIEREKHANQMLWKMLRLPLALYDGCVAGDAGGDGGLDGVGGRVTGVIGNVGCCGGVTGGVCRSLGGRILGVAGGGMGSECGFPCVNHRQVAARPSARCFNGLARPLVFRVHFLKVRERVLGAVCGPDRQ